MSIFCLSARRPIVFLLGLATLSFSLLFPIALVAQETGSLTGRVTPTHDHDFILSTARIPDLGLKVDVAADGSFRFGSVRPGSYILEVRVPTLGVVAERVEVRAGEESTVEVELKAGSHSEEISVTATSDARGLFELASPTTSISGQELEERLEATLGETLGQEAGIHSTFFGPGASRPIIRGLTGDRVRMLEGGIGTGDVSGVSVDHAVTAEPAQAERIEVVRGPGTLLYGSSAIGGVVNVIDERVPSVRGTTGVHGSVEVRGGTGADERQGSLLLEGGSGNWAWNVAATGRETDDYEIPGFANAEEEEHEEEHEEEGHEEHEEENPFGTVPNSDIETRSARAGVTYFFGNRGFFGVSVSGFDTEYGLPGGHGHGEEGEEHEEEEHEEEEHEEEEEIVRIDMEQRRLDLQGQVIDPFSGFQAFKFRLGTTDYEHAELEGDEIGTLFFNDYLETRLELVQEQRGRHRGSFGLQFSDRDLEAIGEEAFLEPTTTQRWGVFTLQEYAAGDVNWQFGARFESQDVDPAFNASRSHDGLSASVGLVWQANEVFSLAASVARSVKLPAAEELFSDGLHVATRTFEIGDPTLEEEVGLGVDVSLRADGDVVSGELTLFRQDFSDFIFQGFTGDFDEGFPVVVYSQEDAVFEGAELKGRIELFEQDDHHVHLSLMGDMVDAELDAGGNLPRIPPMRLGGGVHYHSERWNAAAEVRWVDDQTDVAVNETGTDGYTMVHASLGYRVLFGNQILDLLLRGRNLTDEEARSHTSFLKNFAPLPGRNITLSAKFRF
ncbi:MAG: TonB-dependent receptor [Acidobacteriota bacterium]